VSDGARIRLKGRNTHEPVGPAFLSIAGEQRKNTSQWLLANSWFRVGIKNPSRRDQDEGKDSSMLDIWHFYDTGIPLVHSSRTVQ
jgi:hypothetical protein